MNKRNDLFKQIFNIFTLTAKADKVNVVTQGGVDNGGVLLDNNVRTVYSRDILFKAQPDLRLMQFAKRKIELETQPGHTIAMLTYDNIARGGKLTENKKIERQPMKNSFNHITIEEYGNATGVSSMALKATFDDVLSSATTLLGRDYALVVELVLRDVAEAGTNKVYARKGNAIVSTRAGLDATCKFTVASVKDAIEILSENNVPKHTATNSWVCIVHPHQSRDLRDDNAWINAANYGDPERLFYGEIGRIDDVRFFETTIMSNGGATADQPGYKAELVKGTDGNATDIYTSILFGDDYYGFAEGLPVSIRDNGVEDFERTISLAWYSIFGAGLLHDSHGVVIETA